MQVDQFVLYVDATGAKWRALVKAIKVRTDNDHMHRLAAATAQPIDLAYIDAGGNIQTVTNVPPQGSKQVGLGFYTEVIP